ncbi:MAG: hypothetical protein KDC85_03645 [Saprospiraceae bacterium]|nr:hypothetical protein [Saprospiraceae bacterium]MCB9326724.1 hypothetical protein [Lewinellaceae bacterium]
MSENRKYILDKFEEYLYENYKSFCERHKLEESLTGFITFLIDQELVPTTNIKKYTVLHEYENLHQKLPAQKTRAVHTLAERFNISERSVWGILQGNKNS